MDRILIRGADIVTLNASSEVFLGGDIAIAGGKIVYVGPGGERPPSEPPFIPDRVIDGQGKVAMPGLINAHTHAGMTLLRGYAEDMDFFPWLAAVQGMEDRFTAEDIYWGTQLAIVEMLRSGTTTFADMYFQMDGVARAVAESGIRAVLSRGLAGVAPNGEEMLSGGIAFCERWHGEAGGRITTMMGPHAPYTCPPEYLTRVRAAADDLGVGIHIHIMESPREFAEHREEYGETSIAVRLERLGLFTRPTLAAHCVHLTDEDHEVFRRNRVAVAHCPQSNLKLANGVAPLTRWLKDGVTVGVGTDSAASNNDLDLFDELRLASLLQKGVTGDPTVVPAETALRLGTTGAAQALGLSDVTGQLTPGFAADLILLDARAAHLTPCYDWHAHLAYAAHGADVRTVIVQGRVLLDQGRLLTMDEEEIRSQATSRAQRLATAAKRAV